MPNVRIRVGKLQILGHNIIVHTEEMLLLLLLGEIEAKLAAGDGRKSQLCILVPSGALHRVSQVSCSVVGWLASARHLERLLQSIHQLAEHDR